MLENDGGDEGWILSAKWKNVYQALCEACHLRCLMESSFQSYEVISILLMRKMEGSNFSIFSPILGICPLGFSHSNGYEVVSHNFDLQFPNDQGY